MSSACFLIAWMLVPAAPAELPLFEHEPFDRITLNAANDGAILEVEPLELPQRRLPENPKPADTLRVRLLSRPGVEYEVPWQAIDKVELFEQMVLSAAERLVADGELEEAYDYFAFLQQNYDTLPGLAEAMETYLYEEAKAAHRAGRFDLALAMLRETYSRNPQREGLDKAMGLATSKLVDNYAERHDYAAIRTLIANLAEWFPGHELASRWEERLKGQAEQLLNEARSAVAQQRYGEASRLCRNLADVWPDLPGAKDLAEEVHGQYPRVVVAVFGHAEPSILQPDADGARETAQAGNIEVSQPRPGSLVDWAARRTARLSYRTLMELAAPGTDGGQYVCPLGRFAAEELGRRLVFELRPDMVWSSGPETLTGYDVSRRLLWLAERSSPGHQPFWADLLAGVNVVAVYRTEVDLRRVHVRPERLLQTIVPPVTWPGPPVPLPTNGPYRPASLEDDEAVFTANERYHAREIGQPAEIAEQVLEPGRAVAELRAGAIDVIDRVVPWMLPELREEASRENAVLAVEPYAFPLVHCLVPGPHGGPVSRRSFRRALVYGIDRERILARLVADRATPGCEVADGPFPRGYARDPEVVARPYEPHLAAALANVARRELVALAARDAAQPPGAGAGDAPVAENASPANGKEAGAKAVDPPDGAAAAPLVLAHPANPIAHAACNLIQRHLAVVGIVVVPRPLTAAEFAGAEQGRFPDGVDLLYVELATWEPVADAARLFGPGGLCSHGSGYVQLGLRRLADAADWPAARAALNTIHRAVHDEVSVIPLWQLAEHFAYRKELQGLVTRPITLYQDVEDWRPAFRFASP